MRTWWFRDFLKFESDFVMTIFKEKLHDKHVADVRSYVWHFSIRILTIKISKTVLLKSKDYGLKKFDFEFKLTNITNNKRGLEIFEKQIHRLLLLHDFDFLEWEPRGKIYSYFNRSFLKQKRQTNIIEN